MKFIILFLVGVTMYSVTSVAGNQCPNGFRESLAGKHECVRNSSSGALKCPNGASIAQRPGCDSGYSIQTKSGKDICKGTDYHKARCTALKTSLRTNCGVDTKWYCCKKNGSKDREPGCNNKFTPNFNAGNEDHTCKNTDDKKASKGCPAAMKKMQNWNGNKDYCVAKRVDYDDCVF